MEYGGKLKRGNRQRERERGAQKRRKGEVSWGEENWGWMGEEGKKGFVFFLFLRD